MITIKIYGIDPYLLTGISKDMSKKIADLYEISKDEINFLAPECLYVHDGVEQNTWNVLVEVHAPKKVEVLEKDAYKIIEQYIKSVAINIECVFYYFSSDNYHKTLNPDYPRFMKENNSVYIEEDEEYDDDECDDPNCEEHHHHHHEDEEIYLGNAFEGFEDKINKK